MSIPLFPTAEIAHAAVMADKLHRVLHSYDGDRQRWLVHVTTAHGAGTFSLVQWRRVCQCIPHGTEEIPAKVLEFHPRVDGVFDLQDFHGIRRLHDFEGDAVVASTEGEVCLPQADGGGE